MTPKRCLLVKCKDLVMNDITWGLKELGHECDSIDLNCNTLDFDEHEVERIIQLVKQTPVDIVFTMNFSPTVSTACYSLDLPYASWIYDCPLQSLFSEQANNKTNYFFLFDKHLLTECQNNGLPNLHYQPLAANISRLGQLKISDADEKEYSCDISFVGLEYIDGRYANYRSKLSQEYQYELDSVANNILGRWDGKDRLHNSLSDSLIDQLVNISSDDPHKKLGISNRSYFEEVILARAIAYTERRLMMETLKFFSPRWYGAMPKDNNKIDGVQYYPWLTYLDKLPKAYNLSRINLSTTLHSIFSGISLRVFDIIGAGGFILTNYQPEIEELFDIGNEIVVYHNFEELRELTNFFLQHENERNTILLNGYERICNSYTYPIALSKMLQTINL